MRDLLILGTGVHAREMVEIVDRINRVAGTWRLLGFVSKDECEVGREFNDLEVLAASGGLERFADAALVPDNEWPRDIPVGRERLVSIIDPSAFVSRTAAIGAGCVIYPNCYVGLNARLGDYVFCLSACVINHDDVIGDRTVLASAVSLAGEVAVGPDCYLGQASTVRQRLSIGAGSLIGLGAVVVADVPPGSVMVGNPARKLRDRENRT